MDLNAFQRCKWLGRCEDLQKLSLMLAGSALLGIGVLVLFFRYCCRDRSVESPLNLQTLPPTMTNQQPTAPPAPADQMNMHTYVENQLAIIREEGTVIIP